MTGRGIAAVIVTALLLLFGLGTGTREVYFLVFCLALLLLYAGGSSLAAALGLRCRQSLEAPYAVRGETAGLHVRMTGRILLPVVVRLHVQLPMPAALPADQLFHFSLMPSRAKERPALSMRIGCPHRGIWPVRVDTVWVHDVFGLFALPLLRRGALGDMEQSLTVYPQLFEISGEPLSPSMLSEDSSSQIVVTDHGDSSSGTRLYRDGDSLKRIHWKQSVRTRELHTRQYEMSSEQYNLLLIDTGVPPGADLPGYADMAGECAAALALFYLSEGQPVEARGDGPYAAAVTAHAYDDFTDVYTLLAEIPFVADDGPLDLSSLPQAKLGSLRSLHVLTHRPSPALLEILRELTGRHCRTSCLCPDFPYAWQLKAGCPEEVHMAIINGPADIAAQMGDSL